jgi:hypothetical protein
MKSLKITTGTLLFLLVLFAPIAELGLSSRTLGQTAYGGSAKKPALLPQNRLEGDYIEDLQSGNTEIDKTYEIHNSLQIQPVGSEPTQPVQPGGVSTQSYYGCRIGSIIKYSVQRQSIRLTPLNPPRIIRGG